MVPSQERFSAEHTARLARIDLNSEQLENVQLELEQLLEFVGQIDQLKLDGVEPFFGISSTDNPMRSDEIQPSCPRPEVLRNAPQTDGEHYLVPPVFGKQDSQEG
ncbi:MAG: Asp-tRNA(Asn)/Glu-tRNA(Gln) amidotransferase subunit GatC [Mariniblastus sp.]|nr:Asp-tRNA(Asn)/Glu-tRNA(Gln) amidotransferase subunit GatC [Mariniblastus sp.]